ncbi:MULTISPECIES: DNA-binding protein [Lactococcus]|uniref:Excisionase n=1 Tax=Lactococcus lactis subsp. lactis TaxID=1360 RepID=A0A1V0NEZ0_LACLL|nr:DNA-binding protein [Lactococcus lactis]ARD98508.1 excisionase [Lactococcus lactis subsp. lactis]MDS1012881.1 DNA-binding protein [Lactococcus lactis]NLS47349.1 DNA-binding protein [Lactococcus lactis]TKD78603.1 DNA-binding protein [Lactococcus lactis]UXV69045.1 DNA-binding protein [Lactococcus lactis subsp. lactis]
MEVKTETTFKKKMVKLYGTKQEIAYIFGVNVKTLANDLTAMRRLPEFSGYVLNVGHKRVNVSIKGYEEYLQYLAREQQEKQLW